MSINFYATEEMPMIPHHENGEPKKYTPPYLAPKNIVIKSTGKDRGKCDGVYHQKEHKAFAEWGSEDNSRYGSRTIFYCPKYKIWSCARTAWCKNKYDCSRYY